MTSDRFQQLRLIEAVLFASAEPLTRDQLRRHLPEEVEIDGLITELMQLYANRGVVLAQAGGRFAFRTAPDLASQMKIESTVNRKLSRAAIETLAIISYHQPITRAEIEEVRGVTQSKGTLDTLLEAGWIKPKGRRKTPGRPVTWGTTDAFLDHFGLESLDALPGIEELKAAGLIDARPAIAALGARGDLEAADVDGENEEHEISAEEALAEDFGESLVEPTPEGEAAGLEERPNEPAELARRRHSGTRASGG